MAVETKRKAKNKTTKRTSAAESAAIEHLMRLAENRVVIESVTPEIDGGRFAAKAVQGRPFVVEADIFCDGHDKIDAALVTRAAGAKEWTETRMLSLVNDRWRGVTTFDRIGPHEFTIHAWRDLFASWQGEVAKKHGADQPIRLELIEGTAIVEKTMWLAVELETLARQYVNALRIGGPVLLSDAEIAEAMEGFASYGLSATPEGAMPAKRRGGRKPG